MAGRCAPGPGVMPGPADTYIAYGRGLGQCVQHPVPRIQALGARRRHQHAVDRALARGHPGARRGKLETQAGHLIDLMATCVDLAGSSLSPRIARPADQAHGRHLAGAGILEASR